MCLDKEVGLSLNYRAPSRLFLGLNCVIQCEGFSVWQNSTQIFKDIRKSTLNLAVFAVGPDEGQLLAPGQLS